MRIGSCKLSENIINCIVSNYFISSKEIDVLLWIARRQNEFGRIFNVKYSDVCKDVKISFQEYYNCIKFLIEIGIIRLLSRSNKYGWDFEIIDNSFSNENDDKKRYLNINRNFLFQDSFLSLRANEKKIILKILLERTENKKFFLHFKTISNWIGIVNIQLIKSYINNLKNFFNLKILKSKNIENKFQCVLENDLILLNFNTRSIMDYFYIHKLKSVCRNLKISYTDDLITNIINIIKQYMQTYDLGYINSAIFTSLEEKRSIQPKHINMLINRSNA